MHIRRVLIILIAIIYSCTACSEKKQIYAEQQISVEQQSYVRWHEEENELEVYVVVSNSTKHDVSFQASIIFLHSKLKESIGVEAVQLKTDDRNNASPFRLIAYNETVFHRTFKTQNKLTQEMLSKGVGINISIQQKTYITAIKYSEIE